MELIVCIKREGSRPGLHRKDEKWWWLRQNTFKLPRFKSNSSIFGQAVAKWTTYIYRLVSENDLYIFSIPRGHVVLYNSIRFIFLRL